MTKIEETGPKKAMPCAYGMEKVLYAPRAYSMRLGHVQNCPICAPSIILFVCLGLARIFSPNPVINLHYKY